MVVNILYFPRPARGGIERNLALWYSHGRRLSEVKIASHTAPSFCTEEDHVGICLFSLKAFMDRCNKGQKFQIFVFRGVFLPLLLKWYASLFGHSVSLFYRASNDPSHWWHERSLKRWVAEIVKLIILRFYNGIIFNSQELMDRSTRHTRRSLLLRNPVTARQEIHFKSVKKKRFLFVGRSAYQKNITNLIDAFALLGPEYELHLVGVDRFEKVLPKNVSFEGWRAEVCHDGFHYFIMPSFYEGAPNALLEAVNQGLLPVLTPFSSGAREIISLFDIPCAIANGFKAEDIAAAVRQLASQNIDEIRQTPDCFTISSFQNHLAELFGAC